MQAQRIDAKVDADHSVTVRLPLSVPVGPAEVIVLYAEQSSDTASVGNGPAIIEALKNAPHAPAGFWNGGADEIRQARDEWDDD